MVYMSNFFVELLKLIFVVFSIHTHKAMLLGTLELLE